jgi:hypothetical protein
LSPEGSATIASNAHLGTRRETPSTRNNIDRRTPSTYSSRVKLDEASRNWTALGKADALWVVLTDPDKKGNRWQNEESFATGQAGIAKIFNRLQAADVLPATGKALDFGCGVGRLTQALSHLVMRLRRVVSGESGENQLAAQCLHLPEGGLELPPVFNGLAQRGILLLGERHTDGLALPVPNNVKTGLAFGWRGPENRWQ